MSLIQHRALDHTLLIVNDIPGVDESHELHLQTHYGMPLPEALRNLYQLIGSASQAFVFAHTYFSQKGASATTEGIFMDKLEETLGRAFGSNPPSVSVELGWPRILDQRYLDNGLYGYDHRPEDYTIVSPTMIRLFSEFHWNDFYTNIGARDTDDYVYMPHGITDEMLAQGILRVLQFELGVIRTNHVNANSAQTLQTLLQYTTLRSKHYKHIAIVKWKDVRPIVQAVYDVNIYNGLIPCECGDFGCEDYPVCVTAL